MDAGGETDRRAARAVRAPFPWFGGKQALVPTLLELLPPHEVYVEVFGGAAALLFSKRPSRIEVYNDVDSGLVTFFRVLRDSRRARELQRLLALTPYAREEWQECKVSWASAATDVEMARRWFVLVQMSYAGRIGPGGTREGSGWRYTKTISHNPAATYRSAIAALSHFTARLAAVQIEHGDFARVMAAYDSPATLFYLDPPYLLSTRRGGGYTHELTDADHVRLLDTAQRLSGKVIISGYRSALYDERLAAWHRVEVRQPCAATRTARHARDARVECLWLSPTATSHQMRLPFNDLEGGSHASRLQRP
jgi:DNA adenine methylase